MKVVLVNGSPNARGCTYTALSEAANELEKQGIETEILHIGKEPIRGCAACGACGKLGKCVFSDAVNTLAETIAQADGLIFGSPVYYAGISGQLKSFMDRLFYSHGKKLAGKPAAAVVSARRGGCATTLTISTVTLPSTACRWFLPNTGTRCMATRRKTCARTRRACKPCARLRATWLGCSSALSVASKTALPFLNAKRLYAPILFGKQRPSPLDNPLEHRQFFFA